MPSPYSTRDQGLVLDCAIASTNFWANFYPSANFPTGQVLNRTSATVCTIERSTSCCTSFSPMPLISNASRLTWSAPPWDSRTGSINAPRHCLTCWSHRWLTAYRAVNGHLERIVFEGRSSGRTRTTSGIISPALRTITVSPTRISSSRDRYCVMWRVKLSFQPAALVAFLPTGQCPVLPFRDVFNVWDFFCCVLKRHSPARKLLGKSLFLKRKRIQFHYHPSVM